MMPSERQQASTLRIDGGPVPGCRSGGIVVRGSAGPTNGLISLFKEILPP
jgi:hypothetical protein